MVNLGYMLPTSELYELKIDIESKIYEVSHERMLEMMIDFWLEEREK